MFVCVHMLDYAQKNPETTTSLSLKGGFTGDLFLHLYTFPNCQNSLL